MKKFLLTIILKLSVLFLSDTYSNGTEMYLETEHLMLEQITKTINDFDIHAFGQALKNAGPLYKYQKNKITTAIINKKALTIRKKDLDEDILILENMNRIKNMSIKDRLIGLSSALCFVLSFHGFNEKKIPSDKYQRAAVIVLSRAALLYGIYGIYHWYKLDKKESMLFKEKTDKLNKEYDENIRQLQLMSQILNSHPTKEIQIEEGKPK